MRPECSRAHARAWAQAGAVAVQAALYVSASCVGWLGGKLAVTPKP